MSTVPTRQRAVDLLLGRAAAELAGLESVPAALRTRVARREAVQALASGPTSALECAALIRAATVDPDAHVRSAAVLVLARAASAALAVPVLLACASDPAEQVSSAARAALGQFELSDVRLPRPTPRAKPASASLEHLPDQTVSIRVTVL